MARLTGRASARQPPVHPSSTCYAWRNTCPPRTCTYIENRDWADCIRKYDREHTLVYCDPPYWGTEGYGIEFGLHQYQRMAELARSIIGHMIISVNDIPEMRQAFDGLAIERVDINYSVGGAGRSKDRKGELIIRNW